MQKPVTLPDHFWDSMGDAQRGAILHLEGMGLILTAVGSRIHGAFRNDDDWDVFAMMERTDAGNLIQAGWVPNRELDGKYEDSFPVYRCYKDNVNVICLFTAGLHEYFSNMIPVLAMGDGDAEQQHSQRKSLFKGRTPAQVLKHLPDAIPGKTAVGLNSPEMRAMYEAEADLILSHRRK